jgi:hypothetical protein
VNKPHSFTLLKALVALTVGAAIGLYIVGLVVELLLKVMGIK